MASYILSIYHFKNKKKKKKPEKLCGLTYSIPPGKDRAGT